MRQKLLLLLFILFSFQTVTAQSGTAEITAENAEEIVELAQLGPGELYRFAAAPNGETLAIVASGGLFLADTNDLDAVPRELEGHTDTLYTAAFSADSALLASTDYIGEIILWDVASGDQVGLLSNPDDFIQFLEFSPDGAFLAAGFSSSERTQSTVRVWDIAAKQILAELSISPQSELVNVEFSPDGEHLYAAAEDGQHVTWTDFQETGRVRLTNSEINFTAVNPADPEEIAYSEFGLATRLRTEGSTRFQEEYSVPDYAAGQLDYSPDGSHLAEVWGDEAVHLINVEEDAFEFRLGHEAFVQQAEYTANGTRLWTRTNAGTMHEWDTTTGEQLRAYYPTPQDLRTVAFSPDSRLVAGGGGIDNLIRIWDVDTQQQVQQFRTDGRVRTAAFSGDGRYLASGGETNFDVIVWDVETGEIVHRLPFHTEDVGTVFFSRDSRFLVSGSWDMSVSMWDMETGKQVYRITGFDRAVTSVILSSDEDSDTMLVLTADGFLHLYDTFDGEFSDSLDLEFEYSNSLAIDANTTQLGIGWLNDYRTITLNSAEERTPFPEVVALRGGRIVFNAPGTLAAASLFEEGYIRIIDLDENPGEVLARVSGVRITPDEIVFNTEGTLLASANLNGFVSLWGVPED